MLPSQFTRPKSSRSHMYRRPRSRRLPVVVALLVVLVGVFALYHWWFAGNKPALAQGTIPPAASADHDNTQRSATPTSLITPNAGKNTKIGPDKPAPPPSSAQTSKARQNEVLSMAGNPGAGVPGAGSPGVTAPDLGKSGSANPARPPMMPTAPGNNNIFGSGSSNAAATTPAVTTPASPPTTPAASHAPAPPVSSESSQRAAQRMKIGMDLLAQNKPIDARKMLTAALESPGITPADADKLRAELTKLNQRLVFGPDCVSGDPFAQAYSIESGDALVRLPKKLGLNVDHLFLKRINNIQDVGRLQVGQRIKVVKGPFQAVVYKSAFRLDLYLGEGENRVYVRSFRVGLGAQDSTPEGSYVVKAGSKLINPSWTNPRTHERFEPNDPKNPLGEYWIGLIGTSDNIRDLEGYGIHGTIDPDSIGQQKSMGCIRMGADDIALIYELLMDNVSHVEVHGEDYP